MPDYRFIDKVTAAANITDNAVVRGDGGAKGVQTSTVLVSDAGEMTNPSQPAFSAYASANILDVTGNGTIYTIVFNTEIFDQGGDFSSTTFTAPVTGKYLLSASIGVVSLVGVTDCVMRITTSNKTYVFNPTGNNPTTTGNTPYVIIGRTILADMDVGDTAVIQFICTGAGADTIDIYGDAAAPTSFSGHLVG